MNNEMMRFWLLEAKYQKAKRKAERFIRKQDMLNDKAESQIAVMQTVYEEQQKILNLEDADDGQEDEP